MSSMFHIGTIPMVQSSQGFVTADDASGVNTGIRITIIDPDISLTDFSVSDDRFELVADGSQRAFLKLKVGQSLCEETSVNIIYAYAFHTYEGTTGYIEMPLSFTISMYTDGDFIHGYSGDDILNGGAGDDKMYGVEGDDTLSGGAGDDNIIGGLGDDTIYGGVGDDRLDGDGTTYDISEGGDDTLYGGDGDDALFGHAGDDTLYGGDGDDYLSGNIGDDILYGDAGDDRLSGWRGNDHLYGGDGDDILYSGEGDDRLYGNAGDDTLEGGSGDDWLIGWSGDDTFYGGEGNDWLLGGIGADTFVLGVGGDTVVDFTPYHIAITSSGITSTPDNGDKIRIDSFTGTMPATVEALLTATNLRVVKGHISVDGFNSDTDDATTENTAIYRGNTLRMVLEDFTQDLTLDMFDLPNATTDIIGTPGDDTLNGGSDDDTIRGRGGDDTIDGGGGDDDIRGGSGDDTIDGGSGDDEIRGRGGDDTIDGGSGDDELRGNRGDDAISGSGGDDDLHGGKGDDTIYGDEGNDILRGKAGDDTLYGGAGDDTFYGKAGDDTLYGGAGDDELRGGKGDDILYGGSGDDTLTGGKGADIFVLNTDATGTDTITDFNANDGDKIRVDGFTGTMPATLGDLLTAANLRVVKGHISVDGLNSTTDKASKANTAIYKGDTLLMVLEDFDANLTLDMFDLPNATPIPINNAPTFAQETYTATIARGAESGDIITNIAATDPEGDTLTYSITAGNDAGLFIVDATNGDIKLATPDTRTDAGDHTLTLTVTDSAGNTATATVTITDYAIRGTDGDDLHTANGLYGDDEGDDTIYGNAGDDHIRGGAGDDTLYGGAGDDRVFGDGGDDTIYGGAGDDHIFAEGGNDTLYGGRGDDYVSGGDGGTNLLYGGAGADLFEVGVRFVGTDIVVDFNAEDDDHLELFIYADGNFDASSLEALLVSGGFRLDTSGNKIIEGYESGENDADIHDTVIYYEGHKGETVIAVLEDFTDLTYDMFNLKIYDFGDDDNTIRGTAEVSNHISGGHGDDTLYGGSGEDRFNGGFGDDHIYGGAGYDRIQGSVGDDTLYGGDGDDRFWGSTGDDILYGGADNDWLYGGDGDDTLYGGDGDDILVGDAYGRDGGADIFALNADDAGVDIVRGFAPSDGDKIRVDAFTGTIPATIEAFFTTANLRVEKGHIARPNYDSQRDDESIENTAIYSGDTLLMVLEDFTDDLTLDMFDLPNADTNNAPTFAQDSYSATIVETAGTGSASIGRVLVAVQASDADAGDTLTYSITAGNDARLFAINEDGEITLAVPDVRTNPATHTLMVTATDGVGNSDTATVTITDSSIRGTDDEESMTGGNEQDFIYGYGGDDVLYGGDGDDYLSGGDDDDTLYGGEGNDYVGGGRGDDILYGADGNDRISGYYGDDTLYGGDGDDVLYGGHDDDTLYGGAGDDRLDGGYDRDTLYGGAGNDYLYGNYGYDILIGGVGNNILRGGRDVDIFVLNTDAFGVDTVVDFYGIDYGGWWVGTSRIRVYVDDATETDTLEELYAAANIREEQGHIQVEGQNSSYDDETKTNTAIYKIVGEADSAENGKTDDVLIMVLEDVYRPLTRDDFEVVEGKYLDGIPNQAPTFAQNSYTATITRGAEAGDIITNIAATDADSDTLTYAITNGNDAGLFIVDATNGDIKLATPETRTGAGDHTLTITATDAAGNTDTATVTITDYAIRGTDAQDALHGTTDGDTIYGYGGSDTITGGDGSDVLWGGSGVDIIYGGGATDVLSGGEGDDIIYGGDGDDVIYGNEGDDTIYGGAGRDLIKGQGGADSFVLNTDATSSADMDVIGGFSVASGDKIRVESFNGVMPKTIEAFLAAANLRAETGEFDNFGTNNTIIYKVVGGDNGESDDIALMALVYFSEDLTLDMFDLPNATANQAPTFAQDSYSATIAQGAEVGDIITNIAATDADSDTLIYAITAGNDAGLFIVDATNGDIKLATPETRTGAGDHTLTITATDAAGNSDTATVTITDYAIRGTDGEDSMTGSDETDFIYGYGGDDTLNGGAGGDWIDGYDGDDMLYGGDDADAVWGGGGADTLYGGAGDDWLFGEGGDDRLYGGDGGDVLYGNEGDDRLSGDAGGDWLYGQDGDDRLYGNDGDDWIAGHSGDDTLSGGAGDDTLRGDSGGDDLHGGAGDDVLYGSGGDDTLYGDAGDDTLHGGSASDVLYGDAGADTLNGSYGGDVIYGGVDNDILNGGAGDDLLEGSAGNDTLYGGAGSDYLRGDSLAVIGTEIFTGPADADIFVLNTADSGTDTITDFTPSDGDKIRIEEFTGAIPATVEAFLTAANLRVEKGHIKVDAWANINIPTDDSAITNTAIYSGDRLVMVLEDFTDDLTLDMFDLPNAITNTAPTFAQDSYSASIARGAEIGDIITNIAATDADSDTLTYAITNGNDSGLFIVDATNGDIKLAVPNQRTNPGDHTLTLTATDTAGNTDTATVTITDYAIRGTDVQDVFHGTADGNAIYGYDGDDTLHGGQSDDILYGGSGDDTLWGYQGADIFVLNTDDSGFDVVRDFNAVGGDFNGSEGDKIRMTEFVSVMPTTIESFLTAANLRVVRDHIDANGDSDYSGPNTAIFRGDKLVMVLEYFTKDLTLDMFDLPNATPNTAPVFTQESYSESIAWTPRTDIVRTVAVVSATDADGDTLTYAITAGNDAGLFDIDGQGNITLAVPDEPTDATDHTLTVTATDTAGNTATATVTITDFAIRGTDDGETITGSDERDVIYGYGGDDTLYGGDGNDLIHGTAGDDIIYGGAGRDILVGGNNNDYLYGGAGDDELRGGYGDDTLDGGAGDDKLYGGGGDDTLYGGEGNDALAGHEGDDTLDGGEGVDGLYGWSGDDTLYGGAGDDYLVGGAGADIFVLGSGDDTVRDFTPSDGDKIRVADFTGVMPRGIEAFLTAANLRVEKGHIQIDELFNDNYRHIYLGHDSDTTENTAIYKGDKLLMVLEDFDADLTLDMFDLPNATPNTAPVFTQTSYTATLAETAAIGSAVIAMQATDADAGDTLTYSITGGDGLFAINNDGEITLTGALDYETATSHTLTVQVEDSGGLTTATTTEVTINVTDVTEPNIIRGTDEGDRGSTRLIGTDDADAIYGLGGHDDILGNAGDDTLYGGSGDDKLSGGDGNDVIYGGSGRDGLYDYFGGINLFHGGLDADFFFFAVGSDHASNDVSTNIIVDFNTEEGDAIGLRGLRISGTFEVSSLEELASTAGLRFDTSGNKVIKGHESGENDADINDMVIYKGDAVVAVLEDFTDLTLDMIYLVVTGSDDDDIIYGGDGGNQIEGKGGDDTIYGGAGKDYLYGFSGDDTLYGGADDDHIQGMEGDDTLYGGAGDDYLVGGSGTNQLNGGAGADYLVGGSGIDQINGGAGDDFLHGNDGDDVLYGGAGDDTLNGQGGADIFVLDADDAGVDIVRDFTPSDGDNSDGDKIRVAEFDGVIPGSIEAFLTAANLRVEKGHITRPNHDSYRDSETIENTAIYSGDTLVMVLEDFTADLTLDMFDLPNATPNTAPVFTQTSYTATLAETAAIGSAVIAMQAADVDAGDTLTYSITGGDGLFAINNDGEITLTGALDFETATSHTITVQVEDSAGATDTTEVTINVTNTIFRGWDGSDAVDLRFRDDYKWDTIYGLGGDDRLLGGTRADTIYGGAGDDEIGGYGGDDRLYGGEGDDYIRGWAGDDKIYGGAGDDRLYGQTGRDLLKGGAGKDLFIVSAYPETNTAADSDVIVDLSIAEGERLELLVKPDDQGVFRISSFEDFETAHGVRFDTSGNKIIEGHESGENDADINDTVIYRGDVIVAVIEDAHITFDMIDWEVIGGADADTLYGGEGDDLVLSMGGNDALYGLGGDDILSGGDGDDFLDGGSGQNVLMGKDGADTFVLNLDGSSTTTISDFGRGNDKISLVIDELTISALNRLFSNDLRVERAHTSMEGFVDPYDRDSIENTIIYKVVGEADSTTNGESDDVLLVVLQDFDDALTYQMFGLSAGGDIVLTATNQAPIFAQDSYTATIARGAEIGDIITNIAATDADDDTLTYSITAGNDSGLFIVDATNGDIKLATPDERTDAGDHTLTITATDSTGNTDTATVTITDYAIRGTDGDDESATRIRGTDGADVIYGYGGDDKISGGAGGDNIFYGGAGDDNLWSWAGNDILYGGAGSDILTGNLGIDLLYGGAGGDVFSGNISIYAINNIVVDFSADEGDRIELQLNAEGTFQASSLEELATAAGLRFDTSGNKIIEGHETGENDANINDMVIYRVETGNIAFVLEDFTDLTIDMIDLSILGADGDDTFYGGNGDDRLNGGDGDDRLDGGSGDDRLHGLGGDDRLDGGSGDDFVTGFKGDDVLDGGSGDDELQGGGGDDRLDGGDGDDVLSGDYGNDTLYGGAGFDTIYGFFGEDTLHGGDGTDYLIGGDDADIFVLNTGDSGFDAVADFTPGGGDKIRVEEFDGVIPGTIEAFLAAANLRVEKVYISDGVFVADDSLGIHTAIYASADSATNGESGDRLVMVLEDFEDDLTLDMFDLPNATANSAPVFTQESYTADSYRVEGWTVRLDASGTAVVVSATDADGGAVTYAITAGNDAGFFDIGATNGTISFGAPDVQIHAATHTLTVTATDTAGNTDTATVTVTDGAIRGTDNEETLTGSDDSDHIYGYDGDDTLYGGGGDDHIWDNAGDDTLYGGAGDDWLGGGDGDDTLYGVTGNNGLYGHGGDDTLYAGDGGDGLSGGDGDDTLYGSAGGDHLNGGAGDDWLEGGAGDDWLEGGAGKDYLHGGGGADIFMLGSGEDRLGDFTPSDGDKIRVDDFSGAMPTTFEAFLTAANLRVEKGHIGVKGFNTSSDSTITENTAIYRGDTLLMVLEDFTTDLTLDMFDLPNATINTAPTFAQESYRMLVPHLASFGRTIINVAATDDDGDALTYSLTGGEGVFEIDETNGDIKLAVLDTVTNIATYKLTVTATDAAGNSNTAPVTIFNLTTRGTNDGETITGSNIYNINKINSYGGDDTLYGSDGRDVLDGGSGDDTLYGGAGDDWVFGRDGDDMLYGGDGDDIIEGFDGDDTLYGGDGDDKLYGNEGDDTLDSGSGDDYLWGGEYADIFVLGSGSDTVSDFTPSEGDKIRVDDFIGAMPGSVEAFLTAANLRVEKGHIKVEGFNSGRDSTATENTAIYRGDTLLMVLEDFTDDLTLDMFDLPNATANNAPTFAQNSYTATIARGAEIGSTVASATATDAEGDTLTYAITAGNDAGLFDIDEDSGEITLTVPDTETDAGDHTLTITATDTAGNAGTATVTITDYAIRGTDSHDRIDRRGTDGADTIYGYDGQDHLHGERGDDVLYGGGSADKLYGSAGDDILYGGDGSDKLDGSSGTDILYGGGDADVFNVNVDHSNSSAGISIVVDFNVAEGDRIRLDHLQVDGTFQISSFEDLESAFGVRFDTSDNKIIEGYESGENDADINDTVIYHNNTMLMVVEDSVDITFDMIDLHIVGGEGDDTIYGGEGADYIDSGAGADIIDGGAGYDEIRGGAGDDTLYGGDGLDRLIGGDGDDILDGGAGTDFLDGGAGADIFVLNTDDLLGRDILVNFDAGAGDKIRVHVDNSGITTLEGLLTDAGLRIDYHTFHGMPLPHGATIYKVVDDADDAYLMTLLSKTTSTLTFDMFDVVVNEPANQAPTFAQDSYTATLAENAEAGSAVVTVQATDAGDTLTYSIVSNNIPGLFVEDTIIDNTPPFAIDANTGAITLTGALDFETATTHTFTIQVEDSAGLTDTATITINVTDSAIRGTDDADRIGGTADADTIYGYGGDDFIYAQFGDDTLYGGTGNDVIHGSGGSDTLYGGAGDDTLDGGAGLDMHYGGDGDDEFALDIHGLLQGHITDDSHADTLKDFGNGNDKIHIHVPASVLPSLDVTISSLEQLYSIFNLRVEKGHIAVDGLAGNIDDTAIENTAIYSGDVLLMVLEDFTADLTLNMFAMSHGIINRAPEFAQETYTATLAETAETGSAVVTVAASDADIDDTLTYSIIGGDGGGDGLFAINDDGEITLTGALDYETATSHNLTIKAQDKNGDTDTAEVVVHVTDTNDNAPIFDAATHKVEIPELTEIGTVLTTVTARDADTSGVRYSILGGRNANLFSINENTGAITLKGFLDFETAESHRLVVQASDSVSTDTINVIIGVVDEMDCACLDIAANTEEITAGTVLTASITHDDPNGYQGGKAPESGWVWFYQSKPDQEIGDGTSTYTVREEDSGEQICVRITYMDGNGRPEIVQARLEETVQRVVIKPDEADADKDQTYTAEADKATKVEAGTGADHVRDGNRNDVIDGGKGDDEIDLSASKEDNDVVIYGIGNQMASDGADSITSFVRGRDKFVFQLKQSDIDAGNIDLSADDGYEGFINYVTKGTEDLIDDQFWVNFNFSIGENGVQMDGISFHFKDSTFFSGGRISMPIVSIEFADPLSVDEVREAYSGRDKSTPLVKQGLLSDFDYLDDFLGGDGAIGFDII